MIEDGTPNGGEVVLAVIIFVVGIGLILSLL